MNFNSKKKIHTTKYISILIWYRIYPIFALCQTADLLYFHRDGIYSHWESQTFQSTRKTRFMVLYHGTYCYGMWSFFLLAFLWNVFHFLCEKHWIDWSIWKWFVFTVEWFCYSFVTCALAYCLLSECSPCDAMRLLLLLFRWLTMSLCEFRIEESRMVTMLKMFHLAWNRMPSARRMLLLLFSRLLRFYSVVVFPILSDNKFHIIKFICAHRHRHRHSQIVTQTHTCDSIMLTRKSPSG